ncbi:TetR/AcrR family transcriptional regulator [Bacillus sp. FJAT-45037]|uniref:TetR/AcrR family transcriptional regulator n=1 Tax=Bacillus sp. FJAT-45037 TaxID=2011007 RepID=UPI0012FD2845|nr:TetR/AcrR family transcriptional regulator [Bacillus sp. FJAT-45037]
MARKKKVDEQELMDVTGELLLQVGYDKINFKLVAYELGVGRSTIYEYYANKEELVAEHLSRLMTLITKRLDQLKDEDQPLIYLHKVIQLLIDSSNVLFILEVASSINNTVSDTVAFKIGTVQTQYDWLFQKISDCFERSDRQGLLRQDISALMKTNILLKIIYTQKDVDVSNEKWSEILFSILLEGLTKPKN